MPEVRRGGRPSRAASEQLGELILDAARMFLAHGFGLPASTPWRSNACPAVLSPLPDREALFAAIVHRIIQR